MTMLLYGGVSYTPGIGEEEAKTVKDNSTGLVWTKCTIPDLTSDCTGTPQKYSWTQGLMACESWNLANLKWRLPNIRELQSIVNYYDKLVIFSYDGVAIDQTYFPNTKHAIESNFNEGKYWSSTTFLEEKSRAWAVHFSFGDLSTDFKNLNYYVRCVSGP